MKQVVLPNTSLKTSRLGFGTARLHHCYSSRDRFAVLRAALDAGYTHFDTSRLYGEGMAERTMGKFFGKQRQHITIATKFGIPPIHAYEQIPLLMYLDRALGKFGRWLAPSYWIRPNSSLLPACMEKSLATSLKSLCTDWVDIFFLHEPRLSDIHGLLSCTEYLQRLKSRGLVRYLGLAGDARQCLALANRIDGIFDVLQVEDSIENHEADVLTESNRALQITYGYIRRANEPQADNNVGEIVKSALERNKRGTVLVSSRRPQHIRELAKLVG